MLRETTVPCSLALPRLLDPGRAAIYNVTTGAVLLGTIEAVDEAAAVEKATQEFKTDARWLYAVQRL